MFDLSIDKSMYSLKQANSYLTPAANPFQAVSSTNPFSDYSNFFMQPQCCVYKQPLFPVKTNLTLTGNSMLFPAAPTIGNSFDSNLYLGSFGLGVSSLMDRSLLSIVMAASNPVEPFFNFTFPTFSLPKFLSKKSSGTRYSLDTSVKFKSLKDAGYNQTLAKKLAQDAVSHAESHSTGYCAKYVSNAMARLGIAGKRGDAWELRDSLRNNPHFKEIDINSVDVTKLPAGCVLVYQRGAAGYSNAYGHVEITLGNGKAASDFVNNNIKKSSNMSVFVPVSA